MYIILFIITFLVNSLFMMLTTLLPILVFDINNSATDIGTVLTIFMASLLLIRIICLFKNIKPLTSLISGSVFFFSAFLLIKYSYNNLVAYYFGSVLFGIAIGLIPPAILTMLTSNSDTSDKHVKIYNSCIAVVSAISPIIGEALYKYSEPTLFILWTIGALIMLILSFTLRKKHIYEEQTTAHEPVNTSNVIGIFKRKQNLNIFMVLMFSAVSYGALISYLPVYLKHISVSIGLFYFLFWGAYTLAQYMAHIIKKYIKEKHMVFIALLATAISLVMITYLHNSIPIFFSGLIYGFSYGLLYNMFYLKASKISNEQEKNNIYAIIGLMSYIGVGLAPALLSPFVGLSLNFVFLFSCIYVFLAILCNLMFTGKEKKHV